MDHAYTPIATTRLAVAGTGATGSIGRAGSTGAAAIPGNARGVIITTDTAAPIITFDGSLPGATTGHAFPNTLVPTFYPIGPGTIVAMVSSLGATGAAANFTWLE